METTKTDKKCPLPQSSTPRTDEAVERWRQGKVNLIEEMAKMEIELYGLRDQLEVAMWCLDKARHREQKHIGRWIKPTHNKQDEAKDIQNPK